jgi:hypothetical protein
MTRDDSARITNANVSSRDRFRLQKLRILDQPIHSLIHNLLPEAKNGQSISDQRFTCYHTV